MPTNKVAGQLEKARQQAGKLEAEKEEGKRELLGQIQNNPLFISPRSEQGGFLFIPATLKWLLLCVWDRLLWLSVL